MKQIYMKSQKYKTIEQRLCKRKEEERGKASVGEGKYKALEFRIQDDRRGET